MGSGVHRLSDGGPLVIFIAPTAPRPSFQRLLAAPTTASRLTKPSQSTSDRTGDGRSEAHHGDYSRSVFSTRPQPADGSTENDESNEDDSSDAHGQRDYLLARLEGNLNDLESSRLRHATGSGGRPPCGPHRGIARVALGRSAAAISGGTGGLCDVIAAKRLGAERAF